MALTSRKKRPLNRKTHVRDARLFIIATEGSKTEKQYFKGVFGSRSTRIQVRVIETGADKRSAPDYVLQRLAAFKNEYDLGIDDELWLVIDVDRWGNSKLSEVSQVALQKKFLLAVSNPCFETWLYLHLSDLQEGIIKCKEVKSRIRQHLGSYNSSKLDVQVFKSHVSIAVERARALHTNAAERWPTAVGSHVYKVVEKLRDALT